MVDNIIDPFDWDVNYPSVWPSHQGKTVSLSSLYTRFLANGGSGIQLLFDDTTYSGVIDCQPFTEPEPERKLNDLVAFTPIYKFPSFLHIYSRFIMKSNYILYIILLFLRPLY